MMSAEKRILQDWTEVSDIDVGNGDTRSFHYHVVADDEATQLTIRCFDPVLRTYRLDPNKLPEDTRVSEFRTIAVDRVKELAERGRI